VAALLLLIDGVIALAGRYFGISDVIVSLIDFGVALIFGFEARDLWRRSLNASGKPEVAVSAGHRREDAELRYFAALPPSSRPSMPMKTYGQSHDTLGLFGNA
jgi:hypothetical protein